MIYLGDCRKILQNFLAQSVDLIITSPPYADARSGGIKPDEYVKWMSSVIPHLYHVLKNEGTFILNIKEKVVEGERHTYVIDLIHAMKEHGWLWTEEFIWHKKSCHPGKWPNRFRDAWERCLQFNKQRQFVMYQDAVKVPIGDWAKPRLKNLSETDKRRDESKVGSGFGKNISNWIGKETVYPSNVLHFAAETGNVGHNAAFPMALPRWFIKLFTVPGDVVLDPFCGSATSCLAAKQLDRQYIGIEIDEEYFEIAKKRIGE